MQVDTWTPLLAALYMMATLAAPALFAGARLGPLLLPMVATAGASFGRIADPAGCVIIANRGPNSCEETCTVLSLQLTDPNRKSAGFRCSHHAWLSGLPSTCSYLQRREWAVTAVRLAWLLHFAGGLSPQGGMPAAAAVAEAAPTSLRGLTTLAHMACADALLILSLLFPVRTAGCSITTGCSMFV